MKRLQSPDNHPAMGWRDKSRSVCAFGHENSRLSAHGVRQFRYHSSV